MGDDTILRRTSLYEVHREQGASLVDFGGWEMPLHYGSQLEEHHSVRRAAGMFDVSHMAVVDLRGHRSRPFLARLLANDIARLKTSGKALYSCMLNENGCVLDDLIVYYLAEDFFRLVVNAATASKDIAWIRSHAPSFDVEVIEREELAMIAVQGPQARAIAAGALDSAHASAALALKPFNGARLDDWFVARTGYTGEDGWEIMLPEEHSPRLWRKLYEAGVAPCGLGARDTLRLEAGMNLYGSDMDETTTPLESGLAWTVALDPADRAFIGRGALEAQRAGGVARKLVGLVLQQRGVPRAHHKVLCEAGVGEITSGTFSPSMQRGIALARVPADMEEDCEVEIRSRRIPAKAVRPPFVRNGEIRVAV